MKTPSAETLKETLYCHLADCWALGRVLIEHEQATKPPREKKFSEREVLVLKLLEHFPGRVTEKTLTIVFALHYSQVGQIVKHLSELSIVRKGGKGKPLELTDEGCKALKEIQTAIGYRFTYALEGLNPKEFQSMLILLEKMRAASIKTVTRRLWGEETGFEHVL